MGPREFSEQVVGTIDLAPLYLLQSRETLVTTTNNAPALGANFFPTPFIVPANEIWFVWEYFVGTAAGAGAALTFAPAVRFDGIATPPMGVMQSVVATQSLWIASTRRFWATPGTEFGFLVGAVTLAPGVSGAVVVTKLRV